MKKKIVWGVVSGWMVAALLLVSCAPAVVEEEEKEVMTEPQYGGSLTVAYDRQILGFDDYALGASAAGAGITMKLTHESLVTGDWTKGEAGTGEVEYAVELTPFYWGYETGALIESWEFPDPDTVVMKVRKGVHWALNPDSEASRLVGGREVTAEDIVSNINRFFTLKTAWGARVYKRWWQPDGSATATDADTVVVKGHDIPGGTLGTWELIADGMPIYPPEVIEKYGDMNDWQNSVGTGPFMLANHIAASSATLIRNPNYWMTDPIGPGKGNQLPYLDGVTILIIPDTSTRMAALRSAKVDVLGINPLIAAEDFEPLIAANPEMQYKGMLKGTPGAVYFKVDAEPFDDVNVRRALHMAVNFEEIKEDYYDGEAVYPTYSLAPVKAFMDAYTPLEELPGDIRELFEYNPEKAKQLLDEAGYPGPDRFTVEVLLWSGEQTDLASLLAFYWADIGVTLELDVREYGVWRNMSRARTFKHMIMASHARFGAPYKWVELKYPSGANKAGWDDDHWMELYTRLWSFETLGKPDLRNEIAKEMNLYVMPKVIGLGIPFPYAYRVWWPWLKNYHGEYGVGYMDRFNFASFIWIDQDLKASMGH